MAPGVYGIRKLYDAVVGFEKHEVGGCSISDKT
jgi:hypothetical protein